MKVCLHISIITLGILTFDQAHLTHAQSQHAFCEGRTSGNYADPERCEGYIACNGRLLYKMDCPASLHYNEKTDKCDWPYNINPRCDKGSSLIRDITVCEYRRKRVSCRPNEVIKIIYASYGRLSRHVCRRRSSRRSKTNCRARMSQVKVNRSCNRKRSCSLYSSNSVFGNPCPGTFKYLRVKYKCVRQELKACERTQKRRLPGARIPKCKPDGLFEEKQCHSSTGYCWCVEPITGTEINGSRKFPTEGEVTCGQSWSQWSSWSACSTTCDDGIRRRERKCKGGKCIGTKEEIDACSACTGRWSEWGEWSVCSKSCGGGEKTRKRQCSISNNDNCIRKRKEMIICNTQSCKGKDTNPCDVNNGGCSDKCTRKGSKVTCSCGIDSMLSDDGKTCISVFPVNERPICGKNKIALPVVPIVGAIEAAPHRWIWQAGIYYNEDYICSGALISPNVLVTAASCVPRRNKKYVVRMGDHDRSKSESFEQERSGDKVILHNNWKKTSVADDMAIVIFKNPFKLTEYVGTICLPGVNAPIPGDVTCFMTGWGKTSTNGEFFNRVHQAEMSIVRNNKCSCPVVGGKGNPMVTTKLLCGEPKGSNSATSGYRGDSGGPLVCRSKNRERWVLQGILSWGSHRCQKIQRKFNVFTRISKYITWMTEVQDDQVEINE